MGNIPWSTSEDDLAAMFSTHGAVEECIILKDKMSGRSRGFGFVTMANDEDADKAIKALHGQEMGGRELVVNEAKPRTGYDN